MENKVQKLNGGCTMLNNFIFYGSGNTHYGNENIINGSDNEVHGNGNIINGSNNKIYGDQTILNNPNNETIGIGITNGKNSIIQNKRSMIKKNCSILKLKEIFSF